MLLNYSKTGLEVFSGNGVRIDTTLPKYANVDSPEESTTSSVNGFDFIALGINELNVAVKGKLKEDIKRNSRNNELWSFSREGTSPIPRKRNFFGKLVDKAISLYKKHQENKEEVIDVIDFFANVKAVSNANKDKYVSRLKGYLKSISNAERSGQVALKERLLEEMVVNKYESILYANDLYKCITEKQMVEFAKKSSKKLEMTYIANYVRLIPEEVIELKNKVDEMCIFDNYVILHYDPNNEASEKTNKEKDEEIKKEIERAKDPILFGLINGSNKLYFITDWIDESVGDDLQFNTIIEALGEDEVEDSYLKEEIKF